MIYIKINVLLVKWYIYICYIKPQPKLQKKALNFCLWISNFSLLQPRKSLLESLQTAPRVQHLGRDPSCTSQVGRKYILTLYPFDYSTLTLNSHHIFAFTKLYINYIFSSLYLWLISIITIPIVFNLLLSTYFGH